MGTNYYLIRKMKYEKDTPVSLGCDVYGTEVQELSNGWILRNTYYSTLEELSENFTQEIHIGKSSYGWHFGLCVYPKYGINNLEDWLKLFNDPNNKIVDEYGDEIPAETMISYITERKMKGWIDDPIAIEDFEAQVLESHNLFMAHVGGQTCSSYEEYLKENHAERGVNGLLRHSGFDKYHIPNPDKNATFDYILSGNDPNEGCIFS